MTLVALEITYLLAGDTQEFPGFQATVAAVNRQAASRPGRSDRQASAEGAKPASQASPYDSDLMSSATTHLYQQAKCYFLK
jgi:hypothetical protein